MGVGVVEGDGRGRWIEEGGGDAAEIIPRSQFGPSFYR